MGRARLDVIMCGAKIISLDVQISAKINRCVEGFAFISPNKMRFTLVLLEASTS